MGPAGHSVWANHFIWQNLRLPLPEMETVAPALLRVPPKVSGDGQVKLFADSEGVSLSESISLVAVAIAEVPWNGQILERTMLTARLAFLWGSASLVGLD